MEVSLGVSIGKSIHVFVDIHSRMVFSPLVTESFYLKFLNLFWHSHITTVYLENICYIVDKNQWNKKPIKNFTLNFYTLM